MSKYETQLDRGVACIKDNVKNLPLKPGVYRMLSQDGQVLYVGKAKYLKKRVASYVRPNALPVRLQRMISQTFSMEFVVTHTEVEALLLEANLIKNLKPRYNILLRDGKMLSFIHIEGNHPFPQIRKYRGSLKEKGDFFGPFASGDAVNETLKNLYKTFLLRSCPDTVFKNRTRPCLQYHIKRCSAPCVGHISKEEYGESLKGAKDFLHGKTATVQKLLAEKMYKASDSQNFELAAVYRNRIQALTKIQAQQVINVAQLKDADVIAMHSQQGIYCIQVIIFRHGSHFGNRAYFPKTDQESPETVFYSFLLQFYEGRGAPPLILVNHKINDKKLLESAFHYQSGEPVHIVQPKKGEKKAVVAHAEDNAREALMRRMTHTQSQKDTLGRLAKVFSLPEAPKRIEVYDNSHHQGSEAVGVMVVAGEQGFERNEYRKFKIKDPLIFQDDFGMMREVFQRRFAKSVKNEGILPDLILIDGGAGQVSAALSILGDFGVSHIPLVGIAKGPDRNAGHETFYFIDKQPLGLPSNDPLLYYLQRLRDEAHRFAITYHRQRKVKGVRTSALDTIPGVGVKRKKYLLAHFGSPSAVRSAGVQDLRQVKTISEALATHIYKYFNEIE